MSLSEQMELFRRIDLDGSGQIDKEEWTHAMTGADDSIYCMWQAVRPAFPSPTSTHALTRTPARPCCD